LLADERIADEVLNAPLLVVIAGLDPAIYSVTVANVGSGSEWIPWSSMG
jgi:hypothetical protein